MEVTTSAEVTPMTKGRPGRFSDHAGRNDVNAAQASKRSDAEADPPRNTGKAANGREASDASTDRFRRGSSGGTCGRGGMDATREALPVAWHAPTDSPRGPGWDGRVAERSAVPRRPGNAGGGKGPQFESSA